MVGQVLLLAVYSSQITNSCSKRILMMCGYEKKLLGLALLDGFANLGISVSLALSFGIVGVAFGTFIPTVLVGWLLVLPLALRFLEIGVWQYAKYVLSAVAPVLLFGACLAATLFFLPIPPEGGFFELGLRGALAGGPAFAWILILLKKSL